MEKGKARVICNPASGGGGYDPEKIRDQLEGLEVEWIETEGPDDAIGAAEEWRAGLLIVAGGDGTVNDVVNGLGRAGFPEGVTLGILPAGTGNDLAATLCIPENPEHAEEVILQNRGRWLDVARVRSEGIGERYFINVATGGLGAEISSVNDEELKKRWGKLSYLRASLEVAKDFEARELKLYLDGEGHEVDAVNVAVGNCRYTGGGWPATPRANPEDGLLDVVIIETLGAGELLKLAPSALAQSDYLDKEGVFFARAKDVYVETQPPGLEFTVDGEVIGDEPAEFSVIPRSLKVLVGPDYVPEPGG
ncbi:MAG TPA: diacylglycerol kinase family protein [Rubrobacter sp.]|nr:diacylglycerol kinase family protein [Rubrobacter sp.]